MLSGEESTEIINEMEEKLEKIVEDFTKSSHYLEAVLQTQSSIRRAFENAVQDDMLALEIAILLIGVYTIAVLGNFSPLKCRGSDTNNLFS